jgi:nucleolar protein 56
MRIMTDGSDTPDRGWFAELAPGADEQARRAMREGSADWPADWPRLAVETGFAESTEDYYDRLHEAAVATARETATARERADDKQLIHAVRAMDDARRTANELAERVAEWAGTRYEDAGTGVDYARELADESDLPAGDDPLGDRLSGLARRTADLADEADQLERHVETVAPDVAPNLAAMAGPVLAARLVALAGGLDKLARQPSSTVQVLGAEDALFAHLEGSAPSPKHGVIYTHEYVRGTRPEKRGSAARALAGKLTIAARVDHYGGDRRPELDAELDDRIEQVRSGGDT